MRLGYYWFFRLLSAHIIPQSIPVMTKIVSQLIFPSALQRGLHESIPPSQSNPGYVLTSEIDPGVEPSTYVCVVEVWRGGLGDV